MKNSKMIYLGDTDKNAVITEFLNSNNIQKIYVIGDDLNIDFENKEYIKFSDVIMYKYYYRLLQEINNNTLIILNECLKKQNRYELSYNCIRRYVMQTENVIVFNFLPIINNEKDFAILYDFIQKNPFLKEKYEYITDFSNVKNGEIDFDFKVENIKIDDNYLILYEQEKEKILNQVNKDPDIIPRRLLKFSEKINKKYIKNFDSLKDKKIKMNIVVNQLKVDKWYYNDLLRWRNEIENITNKIQ